MTDLQTLAAEQDIAQLVVLKAGEKVMDITHHEDPVDVYAVQKSVFALLIGIAQEKFLLELDDMMNHHIDPEWTQLGPWDEAKLSIRTLMTMTTGMDDELGPLGEINQTWRYNNVAYQYLKRILETHTGNTLQTLCQEWLFTPLGLTGTSWHERNTVTPDGTPISALYSTAEDLATIGECVRTGGEPIINEQYYLETLCEPGSEDNPAWGLLWWNNNQDRFKLAGNDKVFEGQILPDAPSDLLAARGALGNHLGVSRSEALVVAWTIKPGAQRDRTRETQMWKAISALF